MIGNHRNFYMEPTNKELNDQIVLLKAAVDNRPTKEDIEEIVISSLNGYFQKKGTTFRSFILGTAMIIGALTVILGGLKTILAWIGFTYISK